MMKSIMGLTVLFVTSFVFAQSTIISHSASPTPAQTEPLSPSNCAFCLKVDHIRTDVKDKTKAYEQGMELLSHKVKFAADRKTRRAELLSILRLLARLLPDSPDEQAQSYLYDFHRDAPKDFDAAKAELSPSEREIITERLKLVSWGIEHGAEPMPGEKPAAKASGH